MCHNKTEGKFAKELKQWLKTDHPGAILSQQFRGPGKTLFDIHIRFANDQALIIELDGPWHFAPFRHKKDKASLDKFYAYSQRGLLKEEWATKRKLPIIRLLQEDVWKNRNGWRGYVKSHVDNILNGEIPQFVITPLRTEYEDGVYKTLRYRRRVCKNN